MINDFTNVQAIFFDTSDTLYKSAAMEEAYPQRLIELIATAQGITHAEAKQLLNEATEKLKASEKHVTKVRAAAELGLSRKEVHDEAFCKVNPHDYLNKDKALNEVMSKLARHYKLGIISNLRRSHMLEVFDALGLSPEFFPLMVTEDTVEKIKPDHEPFHRAIELAGCKAEDCLYVGDSPTKDMQPAKEVGMKTLLIAEKPTEVEMKYADGFVNDVKGIANLLAMGEEYSNTSDYIANTIAAYDQSPAKYEASTADMTPPLEFKRFIEMVGGTGKTVLDAGCAFGRDSAAFQAQGLKPTGIDLSDELLKKAVTSHPDIEFRKMDVRKLDFANAAFDSIWCHATLLHLNDEDITKALLEFHRVLKSGGLLFVSFKKGEGTKEFVEDFSSDAARFFNFKTIESLTATLQDTGFSDIDAYYVNERDLFGPDKRDLDWVHSFSVKV